MWEVQVKGEGRGSDTITIRRVWAAKPKARERAREGMQGARGGWGGEVCILHSAFCILLVRSIWTTVAAAAHPHSRQQQQPTPTHVHVDVEQAFMSVSMCPCACDM